MLAGEAFESFSSLVTQAGELIDDPSGFVNEKWMIVTELSAALQDDPDAFLLEFGGAAVNGLLRLELLEEPRTASDIATWAGAIACDVAVALLTGGGGLFARFGARYAGGFAEFIEDLSIFNRRDRNNDGDGPGLPNPCAAASFPTGTQVLMANGNHRNIEHVRPGDLVVAYDTESDRWSSREVTHQWSYLDTDQIATVTLADGSEAVSYTHLTLPTNREV